MLLGKLLNVNWDISRALKIKDEPELEKKIGQKYSRITPVIEPGPNDLESSILSDLKFNTDKFQAFQELIKSCRKVLIYGDYDVDGITSSYILSILVKALGSEVKVFLPQRQRDGYGINNQTLSRLEAEANFDLVLAVDNGISATQVVPILSQKGLKVGVIDHHLLPDVKINPDFLFHSTSTSATGLVTALALFFHKAGLLSTEKWQEIIQLGAIGVVADQMPLVGYNYLLVKMGLESLNQKGIYNQGLKYLLRQAGWQNRRLDEYSFNFIIAPRLNASGRMASANLSLKLLASNEVYQLSRLSLELEQLNRQRQTLTAKFLSQSQEKAQRLGDFIFFYDSHIPEGLLGLIAGQLSQKNQLPALVLTGQKELKGSGRSLADFNLTEFLRQNKNVFSSLGGHSKAAGFSLASSQLPQLKKYLAGQRLKLTFQRLVDYQVRTEILDNQLAFTVDRFGPFGNGRPRPVFYLDAFQAKQIIPLGQKKEHFKLIIGDRNQQLVFLVFRLPAKIKPEQIRKVIFTPEINWFRGLAKPQFRIVDILD